ncbi:MAG: hypothetical protein ACE5E7_17565 [Anaerolineae bacterium]
MSEDFFIEEGEDAESRRPFLIAVGVLISVFILASLCSVGVLISRRPAGGQAEQVAAIETKNAIIAVTNAAVTLTVEAMETEAARPTETPTLPPTSTPTQPPTATPIPTETPVVRPAPEETATLDASIGGTNGAAAAGGDAAAAGGETANSAASAEALPETGLGTWGAIVAAFLLILIVVGARRLRSS